MPSPRTADNERVRACSSYIQTCDRYTFESMLSELGLWKDVDKSGRQVALTCPFHDDWKASFFINEDKKVCNCLSCNRGGNYMSYLNLLHKELLRSGLNYFTLMQNILLSDHQMQRDLGFSSIYVESAFDRDNFVAPKKRKFQRPTGKIIHDLSDLSVWMHETGRTSIEQIKLASLYMQEGRTAREIYSMMLGQSSAAHTTVFAEVAVSMEDILNEIPFPEFGGDK